MPQEIQILNVRLPSDIVKWLDSLVNKQVYGSRSEAIRDFLRDHLRENE
ncbi:ribbon-helix-helix protein, CopG family [Candidatus Woesearchaeota archaeon]|nr:ribbon-helix-helix protein, CopG family [Candidatus Woesearchaeota archaeon]